MTAQFTQIANLLEKVCFTGSELGKKIIAALLATIAIYCFFVHQNHFFLYNFNSNTKHDNHIRQNILTNKIF